MKLNLNYQSSYVLKQPGEKDEKKQSHLEKRKKPKPTVITTPSFFYPDNS